MHSILLSRFFLPEIGDICETRREKIYLFIHEYRAGFSEPVGVSEDSPER
jgi:hypothetical protein